ncbi:MAG: sugar transferase [Gemmatimonadetes bacterium]|jgi:exopolysaccharide biosynthesis polyprenyl glycosylphosphotransferase|nr:sugar transferase [Gemmatimonadota bacterium]
MITPVSIEPAAHIARLGARQRAVRLQRRRFWREVVYGGMIVASDAVTLAAVFIVLAMVPLSQVGQWLGTDGYDFLRFLLPSEPLPLARRLSAMVFCLVATRSYSYTEREKHSGRIMAALLVGLALPRWTEIWTASFFARASALSVVLVTLWGALVLQRRVITGALRSLDPRGLEPSRTLIAGVPEVLAGVREDWRRRTAETDEGVTPGFFEITDAWPSDAPGGPGDLYDALTSANADAIVLVGPLGDAALQSLMIAASSAGCRVFATRRRAFQRLDEPSFLLRRAEPLALLSRPALVGVQLVVKRFVDLAGAVVGLVVGAPLVALIAVLVRTTSRGPVLFKQVRVGLGGDPFTLLKFRTMVEDAEAQQAALARANQYASDPLFKVKGDPRLTTVGRFLRRSSLDELPQLINVLRGEMSLVGPRPALPSEVARYKPHHFVRFEVLPGITGPWQVGGRNAITDFEDVVKLESAYIRGWTVWRDLVILARTVPAVVSMRGAY